jgi:hypothetical protein
MNSEGYFTRNTYPKTGSAYVDKVHTSSQNIFDFVTFSGSCGAGSLNDSDPLRRGVVSVALELLWANCAPFPVAGEVMLKESEGLELGVSFEPGFYQTVMHVMSHLIFMGPEVAGSWTDGGKQVSYPRARSGSSPLPWLRLSHQPKNWLWASS